MTKGSADYVRRYYRVPAKRGGRIRWDGRPGTIVGFVGQYLRVRLDARPKYVITLHPTYLIEYLEAS